MNKKNKSLFYIIFIFVCLILQTVVTVKIIDDKDIPRWGLAVVCFVNGSIFTFQFVFLLLEIGEFIELCRNNRITIKFMVVD